MKKLLLSGFSLLSLFSLFSCKPNPVGGELKNTNWILSSFKQGNKVTKLAEGARIFALFGSSQVSGNATCNQYSGKVETSGANISITDITSTERMCDEIDIENTYLGLLAKAQTYSVLENKLEIFAEDGMLTFLPMAEEEIMALERSKGLEELVAKFPVLEGDLMPHLYPVLKVDNPGDYPYLGKLVDTVHYQFFDEESDNIWSNTGGEVYAVGRLGDIYICRVPGRYVSSDIALFRISNGTLARSETIAWAWCDEGWCNQQDAWLRDVNKDDRLDIIQHYTLKDDKGKIREERMTVLIQNASGGFDENKDLKPDKSQFVMAKV